jgi:soluble lytic murein transglycosylase-like protein
MDDVVKAQAESFDLDADLVRAIITVESSWNPWVNRFEPAVYASMKYLVTPDAYASRLLISVETEKVNQSMSWGSMQVMGFLARELGFFGELTKLVQPEFGIKYGCMQLKRLFQRYNQESDVIAAYNAGSARKTVGGLYENQAYVDKVHARLVNLRKIV